MREVKWDFIEGKCSITNHKSKRKIFAIYITNNDVTN